MGSPVSLRDDFDAAALRSLARRTRDASQGRLPLGTGGDLRRRFAGRCGADRQCRSADGARLGAAVQRGGAGRSCRRQGAGADAEAHEAQRQALARIVESGPIPAVHGVVRWRLIDLAQWVWEEYRVSVSKQTLSRELRAMDFRKLSARPRHRAQNEHALEAFKKTSPPSWRILHGAKKQAHG